jgi:hypothetical protein
LRHSSSLIKSCVPQSKYYENQADLIPQPILNHQIQSIEHDNNPVVSENIEILEPINTNLNYNNNLKVELEVNNQTYLHKKSKLIAFLRNRIINASLKNFDHNVGSINIMLLFYGKEICVGAVKCNNYKISRSGQDYLLSLDFSQSVSKKGLTMKLQTICSNDSAFSEKFKIYAQVTSAIEKYEESDNLICESQEI